MQTKIENLGADKECVLHFLNLWPDNYVSGAEIARRASGKSLYIEDPRWAKLALAQLIELNLVEFESSGKYRVKGPASVECVGQRRFIAPHWRAVLEQSGRPLSGLPG